MDFSVTFKFEAGATTCAVAPGKFCRFVGASNFGTNNECLLFHEKILDKEGWLRRTPKCMQTFESINHVDA